MTRNDGPVAFLVKAAAFLLLCPVSGPAAYRLSAETARRINKLMQHVSTRGEAPPLGFAEVMLAGLARDGGLYVPQSWPRLEAAQIAAFAGRPYAEVAVEIVRLFVGDAVAEADLARMVREAYGTFRHPAVAPITQLGVNTFALELFRGPTLAFKDLAMQLLARLMDRVLAARGERRTIVVATSGDTGGAAVEAFRGRSQVDLVVLFPQGRISDVQRRMMTTAEAGNINAIAIDGTFDDCQAIVKGLFNHHAFADRVRLSGVNSINWARIVAQTVYYFTAAVSLGAPHRKVAFTVPTGNFGDIYAGYVAQRMGLPIDRLGIATNVNDILARTLATGTYELRDVVATTSPSMDIQVSSNFERLLFDAYSRDAGAIRAVMGSLAQSGRFALSSTARAYIRALFSADRADEDEVAATMRTVKRETGNFVDPHTAVGIAVAEKEPRDPAVPMVVLSTAHAAGFARLAIRHQSPCGARYCAAGGSSCGRAFRPCDEPRGAGRSGSMSVEVTTLKSGISVVTDAMPHLETASLGVWVASGSRDEHHDEHGISHFLEHMAFKGTQRRSARQIAEEIEAVGGDLNAATGAESTAYYARVLKADVPLALDVLADILSEPVFDSTELMREKNVIVQEIGAVADTPDDLIFEHLNVMAFPDQPLGRSILGTPKTVRSFDSNKLRGYLTRNYRAPNIVVAAAGAVDHA